MVVVARAAPFFPAGAARACSGRSLWFHIATGAFALLVGVFNLLFTRKGARLHVTTGRMFWYSMIAMGASGIVVAILRPKAGFVLIGLLSVYLVDTGRNALRRPRGMVNHATVSWFAIATSCLVAGLVLGGYAFAADGRAFGSPYALYFGAAFDAGDFRRSGLAPHTER